TPPSSSAAPRGWPPPARSARCRARPSAPRPRRWPACAPARRWAGSAASPSPPPSLPPAAHPAPRPPPPPCPPRPPPRSAASPVLTGLEWLDLSDNEHVGDAGLRALAGAAHLAAVRVLSLEGTGVTGDGAEALARSPHARGLRELDLCFAPLGRAGLRALA